MAELRYEIDTSDADENQFDLVPAGDYIAIIEDSDFVESQSGKGQYLKLVYQIVDGQFKGRKLFENLNIIHQSKQAQAIARRTLNAIGIATDVHNIEDSTQLHNIPMLITVAIKNDETYGKQNVIKKHNPLDDSDVKAVESETEEKPKVAKGKTEKKEKLPWEK